MLIRFVQFTYSFSPSPLPLPRPVFRGQIIKKIVSTVQKFAKKVASAVKKAAASLFTLVKGVALGFSKPKTKMGAGRPCDPETHNSSPDADDLDCVKASEVPIMQVNPPSDATVNLRSGVPGFGAYPAGWSGTTCCRCPSAWVSDTYITAPKASTSRRRLLTSWGLFGGGSDGDKSKSQKSEDTGTWSKFTSVLEKRRHALKPSKCTILGLGGVPQPCDSLRTGPRGWQGPDCCPCNEHLKAIFPLDEGPFGIGRPDLPGGSADGEKHWAIPDQGARTN